MVLARRALLLPLFLVGMLPLAAQDDPLRVIDSLWRRMSEDTSLAARAPVLDPVPDAERLDRAQLRELALVNLARSRYLARTKAEYARSSAVADSVLKLLANVDDPRLLGTALFMRASASMNVNDIGGSVIYLQRAREMLSRMDYPNLYARVENLIGHAYAELDDDPSMALEHYRTAVGVCGTPMTCFHFMVDLSVAYIDLGRYDEAEDVLARMRDLSDSVGPWAVGRVSLVEGEIAMARGHYEKAIELLQRALEQEITADAMKSYQPFIMSRLALAHHKAGHDREALEWARKGLAWSEKYGLAKELQDNEGEIHQIYAALGDKDAAYDHLLRFMAMRDSTAGGTVSGKVIGAILGAQFKAVQHADSLLSAQKEQAAAEQLQGERANRNLLLAGGIVAIILGAISYRQRQRTQKALKRSDELLLNILPEEVADELKAKGEADAVQFDQVTVLFTDFRGFTAMSEQLGPRELVRDIHECFSAFDRICEQHGIEKIKTIGDAYMAAGGLPTPNSTHATDVVRAALAMRDFIAEGKRHKMQKGLPFFEIRIGVHTGPVVAGIVGVKKFQYDIWGDTVNTANRMESSGEVGQVNISEATYALIKEVNSEWELAHDGSTHPPTPIRHSPGFVFTPRGKVEAKGKGELEMYFVELA